MGFDDFMNKVRQLDNFTAKWILRHFYVTFFQMVLLITFLFWFVNMFHVIDASYQASQLNTTDRILVTQSVNITIIVFLMLLNAFWTLYMFTGIQRLTNILKDINYNLSRTRPRDRSSPPSS